jgi:hypothetical protein
MNWQPLLLSDLERVNNLADLIHIDLPERPEVFAEKVNLFPKGCMKVEVNNTLIAYGIAHPWILYSIPPLDDLLHKIPLSSDCLYIHDVVVVPNARGNSLAGEFTKQIKATAIELGFLKLALVSVYGTNALWAKFGFVEYTNNDIAKKIISYGSTAKYMICDICHE